jgi:hypothetical protein
VPPRWRRPEMDTLRQGQGGAAMYDSYVIVFDADGEIVGGF